MRARFAIAVSLVMMLVLAMLISPAAGQTAISPEATPEFWPLTFDPATVVVDPEEFTLVFEAPYRCIVSPNDRFVWLNGIGIFDRTTGIQQLARKNRIDRFSSAGGAVFVRSEGVYDIETANLVIPSEYEYGFISPDNQFLINRLTVYDFNTYEPVLVIEPDIPEGYVLFEWYFEFTNDSQWLSVNLIYFNGTEYRSDFLLYDTATWQAALQPYPLYSGTNKKHFVLSHETNAVAVLQEGVYDLATGDMRFALIGDGGVMFSRDGSLIVESGNGGLRVLDSMTGLEQARMDSTPASVWALSDDNRMILATVPGDTLIIYDIADAMIRATFRGPMYSSGFAPDGRHIFTDGNTSVYDTGSGERRLHILSGYLTMSPDGRYVFTSATHRYIGVYDTRTWERLYIRRGQYAIISPDSRWLWVQMFGIYDIATGELMREMPTQSIDFSPSGKLAIESTDGHCAIYHAPEK